MRADDGVAEAGRPGPGAPAPGAGAPLAFAPGLAARAVPGEGVFVFSEQGVTVLRGGAVEALAPLLDGTRDAAALAAAAPGQPPGAVASALRALADAGLVAPAAPAPGPGAAFWRSAGTAPPDPPPVRVVSVDGADRAHVVRAAEAAGLPLVGGPGRGGGPRRARAARAALSVVVCDDYLSPGLERVDAAHRAAGRPWLLCRPAGARVWIGPVFTPGSASGCWHCLAHRLRPHRQAELSALRAAGARPPAAPPAALPALETAAAHLVAVEVLRWAAGLRGARGEGEHVWTLDGTALEGRAHPVRARPQCPACGDPGLVAARTRRPVRIGAAPKAAAGGTGHRAREPHEVLAEFGHLVGPVTGIAKALRPVAGTPAGFHAYRAGPNAAAPGTGLAGVRAALRAENGGKGVTDLEARVSALGEAVERHSGTFQGDEERVRASFSDLGDAAVHPDTCTLVDPRQYADRERWNAEHGAFQFVCDPFDDTAELDWTPVWSLTRGEHRWLPTALLYFGAPAEPGWRPFRADSNGCAAGASVADAVVQGALELVERDAVALWWYNRTVQPEVDTAAFADPWVERTRAEYARLGRRFWVLDVTSDLGVPAMAAVTRCTTGPERVMFGFGCHFDPAVALRRAVAEMNQLTAAVLGGVGDWGDPDAERWWAGPGTAGAPHLLPDPGRAALGPGDYAFTARTDLRDDVLWLRDAFAARGLEMLVLDQTRPDVGLPVVRTVVPGLRPFWARFAPGRLFDVPVRLGRRAAPLDYADLNPVPLFL
ncbi:TOMM precursor leader peptide-binding protein [Streptomonospora sp. S1-112]|uniref:TOMM leader peptide-binding protein n=1 Tax=Streptomonospora mangrovi TaxID=2883123 RepID=A0A9X3SS63_9ACTN|nr:TOMM precursor leader peptide-binding protein [Streptomonospora mangrovi]MDA0567776.1 TOMM precursor leader peptide-binding protein [Streptomonospora mangrovi]